MTAPRRRAPAAALLFAAAALTMPARAADSTLEPVPVQVTAAIDRGLEWLAGHQNAASGGWDSDGPGGGPVAAITALSAMAFMARGHVPGQGPYGDTLNRAVDCILAHQSESGLFGNAGVGQTMYDHGIATVMLCETYGMLDEQRQQRAGAAIAKAVRVILAAQRVPKGADQQGGWRYQPESADSDISVSGWQLMALRGAANAGAPVPASSIAQGIAYIRRRFVRGGGFAYMRSEGASPARAGTGILALELLGQHDSREALESGAYLRTNPPVGSGVQGYYFYGVYYCAQAAWQLGGDYWSDINRPIRSSLLQNQKADGSWSIEGSNESLGGSPYGTSMAILALSVPYRYLPIYQR